MTRIWSIQFTPNIHSTRGMPRKRDEEAGSSGKASISIFSHPVTALGEVGLFGNLDKSRVVQDVRIFSESPLNIRRCCSLLTRALYLLYHHQSQSNAGSISRNDAFDRAEATAIFFAVTKAFQCKDALLRRLTFLVVRELAPIADDVIIVISSLTQDITSRSEPSIRANAIRALGSVTDVHHISPTPHHANTRRLRWFPALKDSSSNACLTRSTSSQQPLLSPPCTSTRSMRKPFVGGSPKHSRACRMHATRPNTLPSCCSF